MAQVVIFAPAGEDVSAGQTALEGAGHSVEVVEATAANLLHMAIGMVDNGEATSAVADEPVTEPTEELPADPLAAEEPTSESIGQVYVDGEQLPAYVDTSLKFPLIRVLDITGDAKVSFKINESTFSFWRDSGARMEIDGVMMKVGVASAKSNAYVVLDETTAKRFGLL